MKAKKANGTDIENIKGNLSVLPIIKEIAYIINNHRKKQTYSYFTVVLSNLLIFNIIKDAKIVIKSK